MTHEALTAMAQDRAIALVRADAVPDPVALVEALVAGGIRSIEFAFTTPDALELLRAASGVPGAVIGMGTVLTSHQAADAVDVGARFLVTPGIRVDVARVATDSGVGLLLGAMTPTEVLSAVELGAHAVKIFPSGTVGPEYFTQLHGPFPDVALVASGGVNEANAAEFLQHGASAVTAGSGVVNAKAVADADWAEVTRRASRFVSSFRAE